jgi:hypothetical protein
VIGSSATSAPTSAATIGIRTKRYAVADAVHRWTTTSTSTNRPTVAATR